MNSEAFPDDKTNDTLSVNQLLSTWTVANSLRHLVGLALEGQQVVFSEDFVKGVARWFRTICICQALLPEVIEFLAPTLAVVCL